MAENYTWDLQEGLMVESDIKSYLAENQAHFTHWDVTDQLTELYKKAGYSKAELARRSGMSEVFLYQMFSGRRTASRDKLICFCIGLEASLEETQRLLERATYAKLYPRNRRDAIIAHGLIHHTPLEKINDNLFAENERTLY